MALRITTWNVNGIKNPFHYHPWSSEKSYHVMFDILEADIVCFQEIKIQKKDMTDDMVLVPGWDSYFTFPRYKKGYSGIAIYTRNSKCRPLKAEEGITGFLEPPSQPGKTYISLPPDESIGGYPELSKDKALHLDSEGRAIILDFGSFVLIGTYCPAPSDPLRDSYRNAFVDAVFERAKLLITKHNRKVVIVGDLNIARHENDIAETTELMKEYNMGTWLCTPTRIALDRLLLPHPEGIMIDLCREYFPDRMGMYTCWDVKKNKRPGNAGSRIDYILCSSNMASWFLAANIQEGLLGSDHCPVYADLKSMVEISGCLHHLLDVVNPEGAYREGKQVSPKMTLPSPPKLCMRMFPEYRLRQNIKEMFFNMRPSITVPSSQMNFKSNKRISKNDTLGLAAKKRKVPNLVPIDSRQLSKRSSQQTLENFLKAKQCHVSKDDEVTSDSPPTENSMFKNKPTVERAKLSFATKSTDTPGVACNSGDAKDNWNKLFSQRRIPICDLHKETCIQLTTKKPGQNNGRSFWTCQRPIGPEGEAMMRSGRRTEWKCNYFKWGTDV
ncbi:DNA-lyase 2 [Geopyxis carbonaria]|nr:DNA-lyase 2 [Geopyxis carbonaria]